MGSATSTPGPERKREMMALDVKELSLRLQLILSTRMRIPGDAYGNSRVQGPPGDLLNRMAGAMDSAVSPGSPARTVRGGG